MRKFDIRVPCSSANIGPGFDVVGLALSIFLELQVSINPASTAAVSHNCEVIYEGEGADEVPLEADANLITRTALYVLKCHDVRTFEKGTTVKIINPIPLGRGLGSSGAAVVAGVMLGNACGQIGLSKDRMLDFCLMIERHPDNVTAAMIGGFVGSYLRELDPKDMERKEIPLAEVLPAPAGGVDTGLKPPVPPLGIGHYIRYGWAPEIKAVAIIPDFEVPTATARGALPKEYSSKDLVHNPFERLSNLDIQPATISGLDNSVNAISARSGVDIPCNARSRPSAIQKTFGTFYLFWANDRFPVYPRFSLRLLQNLIPDY